MLAACILDIGGIRGNDRKRLEAAVCLKMVRQEVLFLEQKALVKWNEKASSLNLYV